MEKEIQKDIHIETKHNKFISPINHSLIIFSSLAISISLIISWIISISLYRSNVEDFLSLVSTTLKNKGYDYTISFSDFTIATLLFAAFALIMSAIPFIFMRRKNLVSLITTIFSILYALIVLIAFSSIVYICYDAIKQYINNNSIPTVLLFLLPWCLETFFAIILLFSAVYLLITFLRKTETIKEQKEITITSVEKPLPEKQIINKQEEIIIEHPNPQPVIINPFISPEPVINQQPPIVVNPQPAQQPEPIHPTIPIQHPAPIIINNQIPEQPKKQKNTEKRKNHIIPEIKIYINNNEKTPITASSPETARTHRKNIKYSTPREQIPVQEIVTEPIVWSPEEIETIWNKSEIIAGYDSKLYRKDYAGALMFRKAFVNYPTEETENNPKSYNWTIAIQKPVNHGGTIEDDNLLAMNTMNFLKKGNHYPHWKTIITYDGRENILKEKQWKDS